MSIPHMKVVVAFCVAALLGYAVFSGYVVFGLEDPALTGDVIGTWKSFAVAVMAFWVGSSSGGKAKTDRPAGTPEDPLAVEGAKPGAQPVATKPVEGEQP